MDLSLPSCFVLMASGPRRKIDVESSKYIFCACVKSTTSESSISSRHVTKLTVASTGACTPHNDFFEKFFSTWFTKILNNHAQRENRGMYCPLDPFESPSWWQREKSASTQFATVIWALGEDLCTLTAIVIRPEAIERCRHYSSLLRRAEEPSCQPWGHSPCLKPMKANPSFARYLTSHLTIWESPSDKMVKTSVLNDALNAINNAEKSGKRQVLIRPSSKVIVKFLSVMQKHGTWAKSLSFTPYSAW